MQASFVKTVPISGALKAQVLHDTTVNQCEQNSHTQDADAAPQTNFVSRYL